VRAAIERLVYDLRLLLGRRLGWFVAVDAAFLLYGVFDALLRSSGADDAYRHYLSTVVLPLLVLALPVLSSVVALERAAGSIDLALAARSTERYFARRVLAVCGLFAIQGALLTLLAPFPRFAPKLVAAVFAVLLPALLGAVVLFWAVRLRSSGAVAVASATTLLLLGRWAFRDPFPARYGSWGAASEGDGLVATARAAGSVLWSLFVPAAAAGILYLYARRRLRRPETLL
jgi:hypothetical protein